MGRKSKGLIAEQLSKVTKRLEKSNNAKEPGKEKETVKPKVEKPEVKPEVSPVEQKQETTPVEQPKTEKKVAKAPKPSILDAPHFNKPVRRKGMEYAMPVFEGEIKERAPVPELKRPVMKLGQDIPVDVPTPTPDGKIPKGETSTKPQPQSTQPAGGHSDSPAIKPDIIHNTSGEGGKNQKKYAKQLAELCIFAHNILWGQIGSACMMTEEKLEKKIIKGLIDPRLLEMEVDGKSVLQIIGEYNGKVESTTGVDAGYDAKLLPALTALFVEKGWGLTDQQYAIFLLVMEDVSRAADLIKDRNMLMGTLRQLSQQIVQQHGEAPKNIKIQPINNTPPAPQPPEVLTPEPIKPEKKKKGTGKDKDEITEAEIMPPDTIDDETVRKIGEIEKRKGVNEE